MNRLEALPRRFRPSHRRAHLPQRTGDSRDRAIREGRRLPKLLALQIPDSAAAGLVLVQGRRLNVLDEPVEVVGHAEVERLAVADVLLAEPLIDEIDGDDADRWI